MTCPARARPSAPEPKPWDRTSGRVSRVADAVCSTSWLNLKARALILGLQRGYPRALPLGARARAETTQLSVSPVATGHSRDWHCRATALLSLSPITRITNCKASSGQVQGPVTPRVTLECAHTAHDSHVTQHRSHTQHRVFTSKPQRKEAHRHPQ